MEIGAKRGQNAPDERVLTDSRITRAHDGQRRTLLDSSQHVLYDYSYERRPW